MVKTCKESKLNMAMKIQIKGVLRRSGTNYLNSILLTNPAYYQSNLKIREDWFLDQMEHMEMFIGSLENHWQNPKWGGDSYNLNALKRNIGNTLTDFLVDEPAKTKTLITKTPSVKNLQYFSSFFPDDKLIIIIRDPRDIANSAFKTWKVKVRQTVEEWNQAARSIATFENTSNFNYLLVRYEDLITDIESQIQRISEYLDSTSQAFQVHEINEIPVVGSSDKATWEQEQKTAQFQAMGKYMELPAKEKRGFKQLNPLLMEYFGYNNPDEKLPSNEARGELWNNKSFQKKGSFFHFD